MSNLKTFVNDDVKDDFKNKKTSIDSSCVLHCRLARGIIY